jgi:hypothetical protein
MVLLRIEGDFRFLEARSQRTEDRSVLRMIQHRGKETILNKVNNHLN